MIRVFTQEAKSLHIRIAPLAPHLAIRLASVLVFALIVASMVSCARNVDLPEEASIARFAPIPLGDAGSQPMIFKKLVFRIPKGTILGESRESRVGGEVIDELRWEQASTTTADFNVAVTDAFRKLGYDMRDLADSLFEPANTIKVRYELAAILHQVELDYEF